MGSDNPYEHIPMITAALPQVNRLRKALMDIRKLSSAIERGHEPMREGVQEITRMAMLALEDAPTQESMGGENG